MKEVFFLNIKHHKYAIIFFLVIAFFFLHTGRNIFAAPIDDFVTTWKTDNPGTSNNDQITIPVSGGSYNYDVDWEDDGTFDDFGVTGSITHTYAAAGTYTVRIQGNFPRIFFAYQDDRQKILSVEQWGTETWTSMYDAFAGCTNLVVNASDTPDLSGATELGYMFQDATSFNQDIGDWDVSNITDMYGMFFGASAFNQDIGGWDVSNVTDMSYMFDGATAFDQDIGNWETGNVGAMRSMFYDATAFNQGIGDWDVSGVSDMAGMFQSATAFDQDIGGWDVSNVTDMSNMFLSAIAFDQNIGNWVTTGANNMSHMFYDTPAFNQDIGDWDVSGVADMSYMFLGATSFNQDIGDWDTSSVADMSHMFFSADVFDQNIGDWDVSDVTDMSHMFSNITLSTSNYDSLLIGWDAQTLQNSVTLSGGDTKYCSGATARADLVSTYSWIITDGGLSCISVEISTNSSDEEETGGNLPVIFISGTVVNLSTVTVADAGSGSATSGVDYSLASSQVINIPAGSYDGTTGTAIAIPAFSITDDSAFEANETINLVLSSPTGDVTFGDADGDATTTTTHTYTIINDDLDDTETEEEAEGECEGTIGNTIWNDINGDGKQQKDTEFGIENIRVKLEYAGENNKFGNSDDETYRTDTNHNGHYKFEDLPRGRYRVIVKEKDIERYDLVQVFDPTGAEMDKQTSIALKCNDDHTKADFGYVYKDQL